MDTIAAPPRSDALSPAPFAPPTPTLFAPAPDEHAEWPLLQRVLFRFFFVYFALQVAPWNWFGLNPGGVYTRAMNWAVGASNARFFHVRDTLVPMNGSGDTSFAWAQLCFFIAAAGSACVVWSILDRKRLAYPRLLFWLRMTVRYYITIAALGYGIIKLFLLQMSFPQLSQLATPLGDLLPMRLSWLFIGYSAPYQFFSGAMETVAGLLLLYRRTVTAGLFAATGAFMNVVMINLAYDVPVKIYASHLLFSCLFLLALDSRRLLGFLVFNTGAPPTAAYDLKLEKTWQRRGSAVVKAFLVYQFLLTPLLSGWTRFQDLKRPIASGPFKAGMYDVRRYVVNHDTIPLSTADTLRWKDVVIDSRGAGSVNTADQIFWQRYRRGYFRYKPDSVAHTVAVWKTSTMPGDSTFLFTMRYESPDTNTIRFHTAIRGDSLHVELVRMPRHFQLAERQFHWLSEYNR